MAKKELDRFDTKARRNIQIATKLVTLIASSIIASCVIVMAVSIVIFYIGFKKNIDERIEETAFGVQNTIETWSTDLVNSANLITGSARLVNAVASGNTARAKEIADNFFELSGTDFMAVTDASGIVISGNGITVGANISSSSAVQTGLRGSSTYAIDAIANYSYAMYAVSPMKDENTGKVVGVVLTGYEFSTESDEDLVIVIKKSYGVENTIFKGDVRYATTLRSAEGKLLTGTKLSNPTIEKTVLQNGKPYRGNNIIAGVKYDSVYAPIKSADGTITGMFFVAMSNKVIFEVVKATLITSIPLTIVVSIVFFLICFFFVRWLMWRIKNVTNQLTEMSTGEADLTKRCKLFIRDEIGDLVVQFDAFCDKLQGIVKEMKETKEELTVTGKDLSAGTTDTSSAITEIIANINSIHEQIKSQTSSVSLTAQSVGEISQNIRKLDSLIDSQSAGVTQASAAVEQMIGNISSVNTSVDKMASSFESLSQNAHTGFIKQQDVNERIKQIENQSEMLVEANQAISSIAEQTNLLAMNAAIEAAHAGEAGKGFSVVADEIRKLSETSSAQSKTIGDQLNKIKESITEVVASSNESSEAFTAVSNKIKDTDEIVMQIKAAMEEQNSGSQQINAALKNMNDSSIEVQNASKSMSAKNDRIMKEINSLQDATSTMNMSMQEMAVGARKINETGAALGDVSKKVQDSIGKIGSQIDLFKV